MTASTRARTLGLLTALGALILDQGSKNLLLYGLGFATMPPGVAIPLLPCFNLVMVWNTGVTFGLFAAGSQLSTYFLAGFQFLAVCALCLWLWRARGRLLTLSIGLVIGGAIGNLIDRLVYGRVADFFHFYVSGFDWYVFNIADTAIVFGVAGLIYDALFGANASGHKPA
ncbi:MAG: signal peptidase II [Rhizomicrobium sp.]